MMENHLADARECGERLENLGAESYVGFHGFPLFGIQGATFIQNCFWDAHLADVMEHRAETNFVDFGIGHGHGFSYQRSVGGNFLRMALRVMVFSIDSEGQRRYRVENGFREGPVALREPRAYTS